MWDGLKMSATRRFEYDLGKGRRSNRDRWYEDAHVWCLRVSSQSESNFVEKIYMTEVGHFSVVFHSMEPSEAVRQRGETLLRRLARLSPDIMRGKMVIEGRHRHHHQGNLYHVSIRLHLPGLDVEVSHDPERNHAHEDVYVAMRDACRAAQRQLRAYEDRRGSKASRHERERFSNRPEQQAE